jgi:hypothetical protein
MARTRPLLLSFVRLHVRKRWSDVYVERPLCLFCENRYGLNEMALCFRARLTRYYYKVCQS